MSEKKIEELDRYAENLFRLPKAPSQLSVFLHLASTGRTKTVKEMADENNLTEKATERAVAKLLDKGLVDRSPFRDGGYSVDSRKILLSLFRTVTILHQDYEKRTSN
jgi:DNA-binding MarR family transcriptional regulator